MSANGTLTLPLVAPSISGTLTLDGASSTVTTGLTVNLTLESSLPPGFPTLQSSARSAAAERRTLATSAMPTSLLYIEPIFSATVTGTGGNITLTVPTTALIAGSTYYVAFYDPRNTQTGWQLDFAGPASVAANVLTFTLTSGVQFVSQTTYALCVYAISSTAPAPTPLPSASPSSTPVPSASPTGSPSVTPSTSPSPTPSALPTASPTPSPSPSPSPSPTSTPTATPPNALTLNPTSVSIPAPGATQVVTVSESGYTGTFSETNSCGGNSSIATFSASSASGPTWNVTVTGVNPGTCLATFTDASAQQVTLPITVTSSGFTIDSLRRKDR